MDALVFFVAAQHGQRRTCRQRALKRHPHRRHGDSQFVAEVTMGLVDFREGYPVQTFVGPSHKQHGLAASTPDFPVEQARIFKERCGAVFGQFRDIVLQDDYVAAAIAYLVADRLLAIENLQGRAPLRRALGFKASGRAGGSRQLFHMILKSAIAECETVTHEEQLSRGLRGRARHRGTGRWQRPARAEQ